MQERVQRFGGNLAAIVIPNIGAFIAWGLITAFFIPTGWTPNETLAKLVGPMITYLLPILLGYTGGKLIYGHRGGVAGAIVTAGIIVGASVPMFLGAMLIGPTAAWLIKQWDQRVEARIPVGFEMLVNNFSLGIFGAIAAVIGVLAIGPLLTVISDNLGNFVSSIVNAGLLPIADIPIEVGKVLFLNNAINHGVLAPIGVQQAAEHGRSVMFLLETNPGPGLGLLLAFMFAGKGLAKQSAPGAIIIHFFGGIHEIYFPYVLSHPVMILAMWAGGILADIVFVATGAGLVATPGVLVGAVASFLVGTAILRVYPVRETSDESATTPAAAPAPVGAPA